MFRRTKVMAALGVFAACLVFGLAGCSDSPPPDPAIKAASAPQPLAPEAPEAPSAKGRKAKDPFADMSMREKREWRRQQAAKGAGD